MEEKNRKMLNNSYLKKLTYDMQGVPMKFLE